MRFRSSLLFNSKHINTLKYFPHPKYVANRLLLEIDLIYTVEYDSNWSCGILINRQLITFHSVNTSLITFSSGSIYIHFNLDSISALWYLCSCNSCLVSLANLSTINSQTLPFHILLIRISIRREVTENIHVFNWIQFRFNFFFRFLNISKRTYISNVQNEILLFEVLILIYLYIIRLLFMYMI